MSQYVDRSEMTEYEWKSDLKEWKRPDIDRKFLHDISKSSTVNGLIRVTYFVALLVGTAYLTVVVARFSVLAAIPIFYLYCFIFGFWIALGHELSHKTVFGRSANVLNVGLYYFVQTILWNSPRNYRISHKAHHRYTMIRGLDPEGDLPEATSSAWLKSLLRRLILNFFVVGIVVSYYRFVRLQIERILFGKMSTVMRVHCTEQDIKVVKMESLFILIAQIAVVVIPVVFGWWWLLLFVSVSWHIGSPMASLWFATKHFGRPHNVNDHRVNTRSVHVGPILKTIIWGLDDHVEHHLYPIVPSRNLPKLQRKLGEYLPHADGLKGCWSEMFAVTTEKAKDPNVEFLPFGSGG